MDWFGIITGIFHWIYWLNNNNKINKSKLRNSSIQPSVKQFCDLSNQHACDIWAYDHTSSLNTNFNRFNIKNEN